MPHRAFSGKNVTHQQKTELIQWQVKISTPLPLDASVKLIGQDLLIAVYGGTRPHIGAVGIAHPRPGLKNPEIISATSSVYTVTGHKEDTVVKMMAEKIASSLNQMVVVTAGIHWDNLDIKSIEQVLEACKRLTDKIIENQKTQKER